MLRALLTCPLLVLSLSLWPQTISDSIVCHGPPPEVNTLTILEKTDLAFDKDQFRDLIRRILKYLEPDIPYSDDAVELLMLTAAQESHLGTYIRQIKGPARGVFQMEPRTERDIWENFLRYKPKLSEKILDLVSQSEAPLMPPTTALESNLAYQIAMARVHYYRVPEPLPRKSERKGMRNHAAYWKNHYNTALGKGTRDEALENYRRFCLDSDVESS